jgi:uncharacterized protein YdaU (DUF1376 family)
MAKSPAFQLYVQDFLIGTMYLTAEEVGGYIRLLCHQWDKGFIPKDDKNLRKISGIKKSDLQNILDKFSKCDDGNLRNNKMEEVRENRAQYIIQATENGKKGGRPKKAKHNPNETEPLLNNNPKITSSTSSSTSSSIIQDFIPNGIVPEMLKIFLNHFPKYPQDKETDYSALLSIAFKIGDMIGYNKGNVLLEGRDKVMAQWANMVFFIKTSDWFKSKAINFLSRNFQGIIQAMEASKPVVTIQSDVDQILNARIKQDERLKTKYGN